MMCDLEGGMFYQQATQEELQAMIAMLGDDNTYLRTRLSRVEEAAKKGERFWRHHEDCNPLFVEGCRCGLEKFRAALSENTEAQQQGETDEVV